jgi:hypothetical protein
MARIMHLQSSLSGIPQHLRLYKAVYDPYGFQKEVQCFDQCIIAQRKQAVCQKVGEIEGNSDLVADGSRLCA